MIKVDPELLSSASSSCESSHKRAGSSDSDDYSFRCKKSRSVSLVMEEGNLEPYVRRRRSSNEKAKNRLMKMDPEEQDKLRQCINSRERKRMHNLNSALDQLRNSLPNSKNPATKKLSKINTIVTASEWIVRLMQENDTLRRKLSDHGTSIPPIQFSISTLSSHPSPPFMSSSLSQKRDEGIKNLPKKNKATTPKASGATNSTAPPPPPPPPLDPAPQMNAAAAFLSNFPHFFPNFLHHQAAAAAAAAAAANLSVGTNFLPQRLGAASVGSPLTLSMQSSQIPSFCLKDCGNNGGVCLCVKCLLSNKNTVS